MMSGWCIGLGWRAARSPYDPAVSTVAPDQPAVWWKNDPKVRV